MRSHGKATMYTALLTTIVVVTIATHATAHKNKVESVQDSPESPAEKVVTEEIIKPQENQVKLNDQATYGELNLDHPEYFEGDIRLTPKQHDYIDSILVNDGLYTRALTSTPSDLWPDGEVPYTLADGLSSQSQGFINSAIAEWNSETCVNVRPKVPSDTNYVEFMYAGGCSSNVGMIGGKQTISVGAADGSAVCQHGNIVHEISHTLGFFHEHSRPDRDSYISVNWGRIKPGYDKNFLKMSTTDVNSLGVGYDYGSITHYGLQFFTKNGLPTIETLQTVPSDIQIGQRVQLSALDVQQANLLYNCPGAARKSKVESVQDSPESPAEKVVTEEIIKPQENQVKLDDDQATYGELNLDHPEYFEGDIRLTPKQDDSVKSILANDGLYARALVKDLEKLWPNAQVPYTLGSGLSSISRGNINSAIVEWNSKTCVKVRPKVLSDTSFVEFVYEGGCSSNVGMIGGRQTISVGTLGGAICSHGNIVHEISHTLGFFHEHSRPDRDSYISVNWGRIRPGYDRNFFKMATTVVNSRGVGYDYGSITHYGVKFFSNNGLRTIRPLQPVPSSVHIGQRVQLSALDVQQANLLYNCPGTARKSKVESVQDSPESPAEKVVTEEIIKPQENQVKLNDQAKNGELNLDHPEYFEGDILLTQKQQDYIAETQHNDGLYSRAISKDLTMLWPKGEVPYVYGVGLRDETKANIQSAIKEWREKTDGCINMREKKPSDFHYIEFAYNGGCSSFVGMVGNRQYISVGAKDGSLLCRHGNIVHELAHALGYYHEHSRPDRDEHVTVNWKNIPKVYYKNFYKEDLKSVDSKGVAYDFKSVMHYGTNFFAKKNLKSIETKPLGIATGQRVGLSPLDVQQAKLLYKCNSVRKSKVEKAQNINKDTNKNTTPKIKKDKIPAKSTHLKNAVKQFVQNTKEKLNRAEKKTVHVVNASERSKIAALEQQFDSMINGPDPEQTPLTARENKLLAEINKATKNKNITDDAEDMISGEENIGKHYFEGDMMLSDEQKQWFDSMMNDNPATKRALIKKPTYLWQNQTMPYFFHDKVDKVSREYAMKAIAHWENKTCVRFPRRNKEKDYVLFVFEGGCSSRVGRVGGGMQKINIGSATARCKIGNIVHEMGHALGFFHEQSRPDRDKYVAVLEKNVIGWYLNNFHKFGNDFLDSLGVPYDFLSIMHYGRSFFSRNHFFYPTLWPLYRSIDDKPIFIGQRAGLSDMDVMQANLLYHCDGHERLTEKQSKELYQLAEHSDMPANDAPCKDKYDNPSCIKVKSMGYCHRFPRTMRSACGHTCQLCGTTPPRNFVKNNKNKLYTKLKLHKLDKE